MTQSEICDVNIIVRKISVNLYNLLINIFIYIENYLHPLFKNCLMCHKCAIIVEFSGDYFVNPTLLAI